MRILRKALPDFHFSAIPKEKDQGILHLITNIGIKKNCRFILIISCLFRLTNFTLSLLAPDVLNRSFTEFSGLARLRLRSHSLELFSSYIFITQTFPPTRFKTILYVVLRRKDTSFHRSYLAV